MSTNFNSFLNCILYNFALQKFEREGEREGGGEREKGSNK